MECGYEYYKFAFLIAAIVFVAIILAGLTLKRFVFRKDANGRVGRDAKGRFKRLS